MQNIGCSTLLGIAFILAIIWYGIQQYPWLVALVAGATVLALVLMKRNKTGLQAQYLKNLGSKGIKVDSLANSGFPGSADFELAAGEKFIYRSAGVQLAEFKSGGSTYQGTNVGVSVPIVGRVRGNIGSTQGSLVKNPEELTVVDTGVATFTSQRIVFAGERQTREWTFAKLINVASGANGDSVTLGASNHAATSQLIQPNVLEIGPGILAGIAKEYHENGASAAVTLAHQYAQQLQTVSKGSTK